MNRRDFLGGLIATLAAPAIIRTPGLLMPVRSPLLLVEVDPYCPPDSAIIFSAFYSNVPMGQIPTREEMLSLIHAVQLNAGGEPASFVIMNPRDYRSLKRANSPFSLSRLFG